MCSAYAKMAQVPRALVAPRRPSDPDLEQYALSHPATIEITNHYPNGALFFDVQSYAFALRYGQREGTLLKLMQ